MSDLLVGDYLQTQGLRLSEEDVCLARIAALSVMSAGQAAVERNVLWYANDEVVLADYLNESETGELLLKKIFMALDSAFERLPVRSAAVYGLVHKSEPCLVRLVQQGEVMEQRLPVNEDSGWFYLAARSAQTGWLNLVDDTAQWLASGELKGGHHKRCLSQMSLPICLPGGRVLGVLHLEAAVAAAFDAVAQAEWVGLALALSEPLGALLGVEVEDEQGG